MKFQNKNGGNSLSLDKLGPEDLLLVLVFPLHSSVLRFRVALTYILLSALEGFSGQPQMPGNQLSQVFWHLLGV